LALVRKGVVCFVFAVRAGNECFCVIVAGKPHKQSWFIGIAVYAAHGFYRILNHEAQLHGLAAAVLNKLKGFFAVL